MVVVVADDVTDEDALSNARMWIAHAERYSQCENAAIALVWNNNNNKKDLVSERVISSGMLKEFSESRGLPCFEVSAKDGTGINDAFTTTIGMIKQTFFFCKGDTQSQQR